MKLFWYSVMASEENGPGDFVSREEFATLREAREFARDWLEEYDDDVEIWLHSIEPGGTPEYEHKALL